MNRTCWRLADLVSRLLEPAERTAVQGDLLESGESGLAALLEVADLAFRRQIALWKNWQPWLALVGVAGGTAIVLSEKAFNLITAIDLQLRTYSRYGVHYETGLTARQDLESLLCLATALLIWSWVGGFVLAALSGRTLWITSLLFCLVTLDSFRAHLILSGALVAKPGMLGALAFLTSFLPLHPANLVLFLVPVWGMRSGARRRVLGFSQAVTWAVLVVFAIALVLWTGGWYETAHEIWSGGAWPGIPWQARILPLLLASWPVAYLLATSWRQPSLVRPRLVQP